MSREFLVVLAHITDIAIVAVDVRGDGVKFTLRLVTASIERLAFTLQRGNLLLQTRFVEQVRVTRQDGHIL
ncbi:MAG: hypothetical protein AUK64_2752, partial [bacterium P201]